MSDKDPGNGIARSWDANAGCWTDAVRARAMESRRLVTDDAVVDAVRHALSNTAGARILDVGCGEGWLARRLAAAGHDVTGFDGSAPLIDDAQRSGAARFMVLSYEEFARDPHRAGEACHAAVCSFSLLSDDIVPLLRALRDVVVPDGHLIIQTVHPVTAAGARYEDGWREENFESLPGEWTPMPWYFRTFASWVRALHDAGWQLEQCIEPVHPETRQPLSIILHGRRGAGDVKRATSDGRHRTGDIGRAT
jgi:2-polyprenyl-3-methyl-5-hydroxy-6-metoxy-1,4-benzoquinol methylase